MRATIVRRMISATTQVHPPLPPMSGPSAAATRRGLSNIRWVPTIFALVSIGYGVSAYRQSQIQKYHIRSAGMEAQEEERRSRNAVLMDAYGDKSSLEDLEKAMAAYEAQQRQ